MSMWARMATRSGVALYPCRSMSCSSSTDFVRVGDVWCRRSAIEQCAISGDPVRVYTVGITNLAAARLGKIGFLDAAAVGDIVIPQRPFAMVEGTNGRSILESPVSGEVAVVNASVSEDPSILNLDAEQTWILQLEVFCDDDDDDVE
eukprot:m.70242 g.70242  ORF g.70242 m.70242 type:complete len:147 (+) comp24194_c0_seq4:312-752(+)